MVLLSRPSMAEVMESGLRIHPSVSSSWSTPGPTSARTLVILKPDLYYEKSLRHAMRQALHQGKRLCRTLSQAVATAHRKS